MSGKSLFSILNSHLSHLPVHFNLHTSKLLRKMNCITLFECQCTSSHLFISVYVMMSARVVEIRIGPLPKKTEAEDCPDFSLFSQSLLSLSQSLSLFFLHENENVRMEMTIHHLKDILTSFTTTVKNWLNSTCHPTWRNKDLALWKRNKTQTKQKQYKATAN